MKKINALFLFLIVGIMIGMTSCSDVDDASDYTLYVFPTQITAGDADDVKATYAYIDFGTDNGNTTRSNYWSDYQANVKLYVSEQQVFVPDTFSYISVNIDNVYYNKWHVTNLQPNTTYYYCEYCYDNARQYVLSDWKQFTTPSNVEIYASWYGKNDSYYMFDLTIYGFKGSPREIGMLYGTSSNLTYSNNGSRYSYNTTPTNTDGKSPWDLNFNILRSGFKYNNYSYFYYRAYMIDENWNYYYSSVRTAYP